MKRESIVTALAFCLILSGCGQKKKDGENSSTVETSTITQEVSNSSSKAKNKVKEVSAKKADPKDLREKLATFGEFNQDFIDGLSNEDILNYYQKAVDLTKQTGYWDTKDFLFQELANDNSGVSNKFPLDSIASKYSRTKSQGDEITDKFYYERQGIIDLGFDSNVMAGISDKEIEDAFMASYADHDDKYYDFYVADAKDRLERSHKNELGEKLPETDDQAQNQNQDQGQAQGQGGTQSQDVYDQMRDDMVKYYGFKEDVVKQITNEDIDQATERANARLKETGFGDIGLIYDELGKMYPGSSTMYPGN